MRRWTIFGAVAVALFFVTTSCGRQTAEIVGAGVDAGLRDGGLLDAMIDGTDGGFDSGIIDILDAMADAASSDAGAQSGVGIDSQSGSRLQMRRLIYSGSDGSKYDTGSTEIFDSQLGIACSRSIYAMADGTHRCVPASTVFGSLPPTYFADTSCTVPLLFVPFPCTTAAGYTTVNGPRSGPTAECSSVSAYESRVFAVGPAYSGQLYTRSGANCTASSLPGYTLLLRGAEVLPSALVEMTEVP